MASGIETDVFDEGGTVVLGDSTALTPAEARRLAVKLLQSADRAERQVARIEAARRPRLAASKGEFVGVTA